MTPTPAGQVRRLLNAGALAGHLAAASCVGVAWLSSGPAAALSAAAAGVAVLLFSILGHAVQVAVANSTPQRILLASLGSYLVRVGLLGGLLAAAIGNAESLGWLEVTWVAAAAIAVTVAWLAAEIWTFQHLRIPVFDAPRQESGESGSAS